MAKTIVTLHYEVRTFDNRFDTFFVKQKHDEYGILVTDASGIQFARILDRFRYTGQLDRAVGDFYFAAVRKLGEEEMVRPLN